MKVILAALGGAIAASGTVTVNLAVPTNQVGEPSGEILNGDWMNAAIRTSVLYGGTVAATSGVSQALSVSPDGTVYTAVTDAAGTVPSKASAIQSFTGNVIPSQFGSGYDITQKPSNFRILLTNTDATNAIVAYCVEVEFDTFGDN